MKRIHVFKPFLTANCCGLILVSMFFSFCNKNATLPAATMPAATQNGSNTMGAYVNDTLWVPKLSFFGTGIDVGCQAPLFSIDARAQDANGKSNTGLFIYIRDFKGVGTYILNANAEGVIGDVAELERSKSLNGGYTTDSLHTGSVTVTHYDTKKQIVSGTFHVKLINPKNPADSVSVTSGRFDTSCSLTELN